MELLPASVIRYSCVGKELLEGGGGGRETGFGVRMKIKCIHWCSILTKVGALEY